MGLGGPRLPAFEVLQVRLMVATDLVDAVTAELLEEGVHEHDGHHRFPDHARGGDRTDVAAPDPPLHPPTASTASRVSRSTDRIGFRRVEIGFMAARTTTGWPLVTPPSSPPAL